MKMCINDYGKYINKDLLIRDCERMKDGRMFEIAPNKEKENDSHTSTEHR